MCINNLYVLSNNFLNQTFQRNLVSELLICIIIMKHDQEKQCQLAVLTFYFFIVLLASAFSHLGTKIKNNRYKLKYNLIAKLSKRKKGGRGETLPKSCVSMF